MSESDAYIEAVLARHLYQPGSLVPYAVHNVIGKLKQWAGTNLNRIVFIGSMPKLTAVSGTTDIDIFVSLNENTPHTLEEIYDKLYDKASSEGWIPRRQNVSIRTSYLGVGIDLVPGRLQPGILLRWICGLKLCIERRRICISSTNTIIIRWSLLVSACMS